MLGGILGSLLPLFFSLDLLPDGARELVHDSPNWSVHLFGSPEEARELAAALEAALPQFEKVVGEKLPRAQRRRVPLRLHEDRESWLARIRAEGEEPPAECDFVYYSRANDAVHVYRGASEYLTRSLVLQGAFQRFHCKARPKNEDLVRTWYVMGLADHLALHQWDGATLRLGALPTVALGDLPAAVLRRLDPRRFDPERLFSEGLGDGVVCFALVRHLLEGDARTRARFEKLVLGHGGSKLGPEDYARQLGSPIELTGELLRWFGERQQPFHAEFGDWEDRGGAVLRGRPLASSGLAVALAKAELQELSASVLRPDDPEAFAGLVFGYVDAAQHWRAGVRGDAFVVEEIERGELRFSYVHALPDPQAAVMPMALSLAGDRARITLAREPVGEWKVPAGRAGLACAKGPVELRSLRWR